MSNIDSTKRYDSDTCVTTQFRGDSTEVNPLRRWIKAYTSWLSAVTTNTRVFALADQAVISATNFTTGIIIGRTCTQQEFGLYMLGFSLVLLILNMQNSLISSPYTVYSAMLRGRDLACYAGSTLLHFLALCALAIITLALIGMGLSLFFGFQELVPIVLALNFVVAFIMLREYARRIFFASLRMSAAFVMDSCVAVSQVLGLLVLSHSSIISASWAFFNIGAACGLFAVSWLLWIRKEFAFEISQVISDFVRNISFGKWVFASNIIILLSIQLYPWLIAWFQGTKATGIFAASWSVVAVANTLLLGFGNFLGPETAHAISKGSSELKQLVQRVTVVLAGISGLFFIGMLIFGGQFIEVIYTSKYAGNGTLVSILALGIVGTAIGSTAAWGIWAMKRPEVNFKINILTLFISISIGVWLVKTSGIIGAGLGLLVSNFISSTIRFLYFIKLSSKKSSFVN